MSVVASGNMSEIESEVGERSLLKTPPPTNQPTNSIPEEYLSIRLTIGECQFTVARTTVFKDCHYIAYRHNGKFGTNPHYHVLVLSTNAEKFRKRIKDNLPVSGNKYVSIKHNKNGLLAGIQYCSKEGSYPITSSDELHYFIDQAPKWVQTTIPTGDNDKCKDKDWQLTYTNLVCVAVKYARTQKTTSSLKATVRDLIKNTKWRPSKWLITGGVPEFYERDFDMRMGKVKEPDMNWWTPRSI